MKRVLMQAYDFPPLTDVLQEHERNSATARLAVILEDLADRYGPVAWGGSSRLPSLQQV